MLSVIRELAEEAEDPRNAALEPAALLKKLIERGEDALARTPDQLAVLREAGVVDAGGAGLLEIVRGVSAALSGEPIPDAPAEDAHEAGLDAVHQELSEFRYCTVFVIEGEQLDAEALEPSWSELGDSLLVVGDSSALKVHVHTDEPGQRARVRDGARDDRGRRDREHAQADGASARSGSSSRSPTLR